MDTTAKIKVISIMPGSDGQSQLNFGADYADERNKEWAKYTPSMTVMMQVLNSVAERFTVGQAFTLTFSPEVTEGTSNE